MQTDHNTAISIKRENFGQKNSVMLLIVLSAIFLLGVLGAVLYWKNGLCAIGVLGICYLLWKNEILKLTIIPFAALSLLILLSYILHLGFIEMLLITSFLSFSFFLKSAFETTKEENKCEIFYIDKKTIRCLAFKKNNDYKGYTLDPKSYLQNYVLQNVTSFDLKSKKLIIHLGNKKIVPLELTVDETNEVLSFIKTHFPYLLGNGI